MAHLMPLNQTKVFKRVPVGALLMKNEYDEASPMVRLMTSQTVFPGRPCRHKVTRLFVNSYSMGPFVPSETRRLYQKTSCKLFAKCETFIGSFSSGGT
jgi:hypothetical protein